MITQTIDTLDEVVPYTANYFENIALRNNALVTNVFPQFNTAIGQINAELAVMNGYATSTSTAAANALAYSNNAAASAAVATAKANLVTAVVIPTEATYSYTQQDWRQSMMSKAEFNAVAAERRANRAGSGFDEFGKHIINNSPNGMAINEGLSVFINDSNDANKLQLGYYNSNSLYLGGVSKTNYPMCSINGINHILNKINKNDTSQLNSILLPPAPTVLPSTATLTQQQIDSGVIKHADSSNSGLLLNGRNLVDTSGWLNGAGSHAVSSGKLQITNGTSVEGYDSQSYVTVIGKKYKLEIVTTDGTSLSNSIKVGNSIGASTLVNLSNVTTATRTEVEFTATATLTYLTLGTGTTTTGETALFGEMGIFPADAISRSDLVFLESWHEDVSEKDFVYPLGNVQYLGTTGDAGTPVAGAFAGAATYSLFSDTWQADSALIGKGYVWSTLSDANKKAFVANPENNCYLDGDKVIQVRYRMRVVMGQDAWSNISSQVTSNAWIYNSDSNFVKPKGKISSLPKDLAPFTEATVSGYYASMLTPEFNNKENGLFGVTSPYYDIRTAYEGKCFAMPIALVHRRNQGMKHDTYNPNGTKLASDGLNQWLTSVAFTSIADCFTDSKLLTASGYIGTTTGRADGIFYDQVHEGDITDLRNSSRSINDYIRTTDKWFAKLQDATYRGTEGEKYTEAKIQTTTGTVATVEVNDGTRYKSGDTIYIYDLTASAIKGRFTVKSISTNTLTVDVTFAKLANNYLISGASSTRTKSNTMTVYDVIGNPANYHADWKTQYASLTSLHTAEDGASLLPTGTTGSDGLAVFKLSRDANATPLQVLKSTDSGVTWTALTVTTHYTFSTTTNAITFTAGNIPLVADLIRVTYQTHTNMCTATTNQAPIAIGEAIATNGVAHGHLVSSLIGKVPTASTAPYAQFGYDTYGYRIDATTLKFSTTSTEFPLHTAFTLAGGALGVATVKAFPYLTSSDGRAYVNIPFKEMKHNGTSYGDDGKFFMTDNVTTTTDNNALTVLTGTKRIELPYFISVAE